MENHHQITKKDNSTQPEGAQYTGDVAAHRGPVLAEITGRDGLVTVTVNPAVQVASVRVFTRDGADSPAAEAARNTRIRQDADRLVVTIPHVDQKSGRQFGSTTMSFSDGSVHISGAHNGGNVGVFNGGVFNNNNNVQNITSGVEVHVTLPAGSGVQYSGENGSLHAFGIVAAIKSETTNGSIKAEVVGRIEAEATNGSVKVDTVTEWIDAKTSNGSVKVEKYEGRAARIRAGNGSVNFTVGSSASGKIDIKTGNGSVKLYGVRDRGDLDVRASAGNGTVKKF